MKKWEKVLLVILVLIAVGGCLRFFLLKDERSIYYAERADAYREVAEYVMATYVPEEGEHVTVSLYDISGDAQLEESLAVVMEKFSGVWVQETSVLFWNDETKTLGLIYSTKMRKDLKSLKEWYHHVDTMKIEKDLYLIGQFNAL